MIMLYIRINDTDYRRNRIYLRPMQIPRDDIPLQALGSDKHVSVRNTERECSENVNSKPVIDNVTPGLHNKFQVVTTPRGRSVRPPETLDL